MLFSTVFFTVWFLKFRSITGPSPLVNTSSVSKGSWPLTSRRTFTTFNITIYAGIFIGFKIDFTSFLWNQSGFTESGATLVFFDVETSKRLKQGWFLAKIHNMLSFKGNSLMFLVAAIQWNSINNFGDIHVVLALKTWNTMIVFIETGGLYHYEFQAFVQKNKKKPPNSCHKIGWNRQPKRLEDSP